jgi:hypothetical protein
MTKAQQKAWKILTDEEKMALSLSLSHGKSTWEAGEIMGKAHYKYLEIRQRAEKFLKLFTDYFEIYDYLIPVGSILDKDFKQYIRFTLENRLPIKRATLEMGSDIYGKIKSREIEILREVQSLKGSKFVQDNNLYHLIMDFDRWNNFRILPLSIQEPSAFKRRNKHKLRKLVNLFTSLHPLSILKIKQIYEVKRKGMAKNCFFLPLITVNDLSLTQIIAVPNNTKNLRVMNNLILYIFRDAGDAKRFLEIITLYIEKDYKHCRDGQKFWPEFRILTKKAINYDIIQNISPTRKYVLDNAGIDHDFQWFMSNKNT